MDRVKMIRSYVDNIIHCISSTDERKAAYIHTYGVAQACSIIAGRRGLNAELAYISGLLHDIYAYKTGSYSCHSQSGAEMARPVLRDMKVFSDNEQMLILSAIFHHANKDLVHDEYDEVLKDADILQPFLNDASLRIFHLAVPRLKNMLKEFTIKAEPEEYGFYPNNSSKVQDTQNIRLMLANIAEELARKKVCGERTDNNFMEIIKYYPEASAFDELKNAWCAAFVYHSCMKAGIELPIKTPPASCRFAGVGAWYEWGKHNNFCFYEKDGFIPEKGDIVIYNNIIPPENKPENLPCHDHIGIVLSSEGEQLIVAEGNIDNKNVAGITTRKRDDTIGCYVRIPDNYVYDGWRYDYKTGKIRVASFSV